jgi:hypothetical protein
MKLLDGIKSFFQKPKVGYVYAVTAGEYLGEFLVYIESRAGNLMFLSLPDMKVRSISEKEVTSGIDNNILDKVEKLPSDVFSVCNAQYYKTLQTPKSDANVPSNDVVKD